VLENNIQQQQQPRMSNNGGTQQQPSNIKEMIATGKVDNLIFNPGSMLDQGRPSQLPPKSQEEIAKHQREYEEIQKKAKKTLEKEAKEKEKQDQVRKEKEKSLIDARRVWEDDIIPNWDPKKKDPGIMKRIREVSWRGLPPAVRGKVWKMAVGNDLRITNDLFTISLGHANNALLAFNRNNRVTSPKHNDDDDSPPRRKHSLNGKSVLKDSDDFDNEDVLGVESTSLGLILQDIQDTFPSLMIFQKSGPLHNDLIDVLGAYICNRPDIGYVPGMTFLGAMFLLNMEKYDAFQCLSNHINKNCFLAFFRQDQSGIPKYLNAMDATVEAMLPKLHKHFKDVGISAKHYLVDWITTLFSKTLPLDIATRIWDLTFLEGEIFVYRTSLAILRLFIADLESATYDQCIDLFTQLPQRKIQEDQFFDEVASIVLDQRKFDKLLE
ncbi:hypothetical protein SAMD00019534_065130, partial [Acytostelium subglobosum LB1]|uniref:hypothetical protein n=1 Tax=Acytostelium subglobosum LB1 TaxID=1410327 RepID=UPI0006449085